MAPVASARDGDGAPGAPPSEARDDVKPRQAADAIVVAGALRAAAKANAHQEIEALLSAGVPPDDLTDGKPGTPLLTALETGAVDATRLLLHAGASVDVVDPLFGGNAAHAAARSPDPQCAAMVIRVMAQAIETSNRQGDGKSGKLSLNLDARDSGGRTPLEVAMRRRSRKCSIGRNNAAANGSSTTGSSATTDGGAYRVTRALLDSGASANAAFENGVSPLAAAVAAGDGVLAALLLEKGADPERGGGDSKTLASPALVAIRSSNVVLLEMLLELGADVDGASPCSSSAFAPSAAKGAEVLGKAGVRSGWAEVGQPPETQTVGKETRGEAHTSQETVAPQKTQTETSKATPLQLACSLGELECVQTLLRAGAVPDVPRAMPPAVCAAAGGHTAVVALLLSLGVMDPWSCDARGVTALHYASARGHTSVVTVLTKELLDIAADETEARGASQAGASATQRSLQQDSEDSDDDRKINSTTQSRNSTFLDSPGFKSVTSLFTRARRFGGSRTDPKASELATGKKDKPEKPPSVSLIDVPDFDGQTALYAACAEGHASSALVLLRAGADGTKRFPPHQETVLHVAAAFDRAEVVRALVGDATFGESLVNSVDALGRTPLVVAAAAGASRTCSVLLEVGADPNGNSDRSDPPTSVAARRGDYRLVQTLVGAGACVTHELESRGVPYTPTPHFFKETAVLQGHSNQVVSTRFHPSDPAICATAGKDGALRVFREIATGDDDFAETDEPRDDHQTTAYPQRSKRWTLGVSWRCHDVSLGGATHASWANGGDRLVTSGLDGRVCVWTLPKTTKAPTVAMHSDNAVFHAQWSSDDKRVVCVTGDALSFWDAATGVKVMTSLSARGGARLRAGAVTDFGDTTDDLTRCTYARFRNFVACAGVTGNAVHDGNVAVSLWDPESGVRTARGVTFSADQVQVGAGRTNHGTAYNTNQFANRKKKRLTGGCHLSSDDACLVTCDFNGWVRVWDPRLIGGGARGVVAKWKAHVTGGVTDCVFSPDARCVATASGDGTCVLWDTRRDAASSDPLCVLSLSEKVGFGCCAFSSTGNVFAAGTKNTREELLHSRGLNVAAVWEGE